MTQHTLTPGVPPRRRAARRRHPVRLLMMILALLCTVGLAALAPATAPATARADGIIIGDTGGTFPPPDLLNTSLLSTGVYAATPDQTQSLQNLETTAISNTLHDHALPASDAVAVQSWGRIDAETELFALLVQAIATPAISRTVDQQNAVDWMTAVVRRNNVQAAQDAGLEYVKWAGLDQSAYQNLLAGTPSQSSLQSFLSGSVLNYNNGGSAANPGASTGGYCVYHSPAPYGSEYTGYDDQTCFTPCTNVGGCAPPTPSYDQFVKWGEADVNNALVNTLGFARSANSLASGVALAGALAGTTISAALGSSSALGTALVGTTLQQAVFPYTARVDTDVLKAAIKAARAAARAAGEDPAAAAAAEAEVEADALANGAEISAEAVGFTVGVAIAAIAIAVQEGISVVNAANLPGQLATLIASAPSTTPDLGAMLADQTQSTALFGLFVGATLPTPLSTSCDNSDSGYSFAIGSANNPNPITIPVPCLNAPPIPDPANADPFFDIASRTGTHTLTTTLALSDTTTGLTSTVRMSGHWFVAQASDPDLAAPPVQTLRIHYTDWNGAGRTASLFYDPNASGTDSYDLGAKGAYTFYTVVNHPDLSDPRYGDLQFCFSDPVCASYFVAAETGTITTTTPIIDYIGADGQDYSAQVLPAEPPTVTASTSANPVEGSPVTFTASGSSPLKLPLTYQWQFVQPPSSGLSQCAPTGCPYLYLSGPQVSSTWPTSGNYQVQVTATDPLGKQAVDTFTISVADVPPTLTLNPTLTPSNQFFCHLSGLPCETHTVPLGSVTTLHGSIAHTGSADTENVDINWGDGTPDDLASIGEQFPLQSSNITLTAPSGTSINLTATHAYAAAGTYPVTVTVTDQSGATAVVTTTETAAHVTALTWSAPAAITYGTALDATQLDAAASATTTVAGPSLSVPGAFAYSVDGTPVSAADKEMLPAGKHTLTVQFTPDDTTLYTTPDPVSVPLTVTQAPLTITASSPSQVYNGTVPAITPGYSGFVNGESATSLTTVPTCTSAAPRAGTAGTYQTSCAGAVDANYGIGYVPGTLTISQAGTTTTLSSSVNPAVWGQSVTLTATVAVNSPGAGNPTGTVAFKDGTGDIGGCAAQPVDTTTETATCTTSALSVGQHSFTASYSGDANFTGSASAALTQTVNKAATGTGLRSSSSAVMAGQPITFTAPITVQSPGAGTPTGTVTFYDGTTGLGTGTLSTNDGADQATVSTSSLSLGAHTLTARYGGDADFNVSASAPITQYVDTNLSSYPTTASGAYDLSNANLAGAYLGDAPLAGADLSGSNLKGATFTVANLSGADLSHSNFMTSAASTDFSNANLSNANLSNSNFKGATFSGANLTGANMTGANLMGAIGLRTATLSGVTWSATLCPDGTSSDKDGGTCVGHL